MKWHVEIHEYAEWNESIDCHLASWHFVLGPYIGVEAAHSGMSRRLKLVGFGRSVVEIACAFEFHSNNKGMSCLLMSSSLSMKKPAHLESYFGFASRVSCI